MALIGAPTQLPVVGKQDLVVTSPWATWLLELVSTVNGLNTALGFVPYLGATTDLDLGVYNILAANLSGSNTGDQTITLTGDVIGSGTGSFLTTLVEFGDVTGNRLNLTDSLIAPIRDSYFRGMTLGLGSGDQITNTVFGYQALLSNSTGLNQVAIGYQALAGNTTGNYNVAIGYQALKANTTGTLSIAIGYKALALATGSGGDNTAVGSGALSVLTSGRDNIAFGTDTLVTNVSGDGNLAIGLNTLASVTTTDYSTAVGFNSLADATGASNVALGAFSGTTTTTGEGNVFIGLLSRASAAGDSGCVVVGNVAVGLGTNTTVLGNSSTTFGRWWGRLLLGTSTDDATSQLQVTGNTVLTGNLTLSGSARRITGDFSSATIASRTIFQSSTTNGNTTLTAIPNGAGTVAQLSLETDPALTTGATAQMTIIGATQMTIASGIRGAGTYLPMVFTTSGAEAMRINTTGFVGIGTGATPSHPLTVAHTAADIADVIKIWNPTAVAAGVGSRMLWTGGTAGNGLGGITCAFTGAATADGSYMTFQTRAVTTGILTEAMRIDTSRNVSIATGNLTLPKTSGIGIRVDPAAPTFGWRDILGQIIVKAVGANDPVFNVFRGSIRAYQYSNAIMNEAWVILHIPHDYVPSTDLFMHVHWAQITVDTGGAAGVPGVAKWYFDVTYADGHGTAGGAADPFIAPYAVSVTQQGSTTQYGHMIAEVQITGASLAASTILPDGLLIVRVYRDPADVADTLNQAPFLLMADCHYQSTNIGTKQKAPDFYT